VIDFGEAYVREGEMDQVEEGGDIDYTRLPLKDALGEQVLVWRFLINCRSGSQVNFQCLFIVKTYDGSHTDHQPGITHITCHALASSPTSSLGTRLAFFLGIHTVAIMCSSYIAGSHVPDPSEPWAEISG
jgi:hypothetical protein